MKAYQKGANCECLERDSTAKRKRYLPPNYTNKSRYSERLDRPDVNKVPTGGLLQRLCPNMDRDQLAIAPRGEESNELDGFQHYSVEDEQDGYTEKQLAVPTDIRIKGGAQRSQYAIKGQLPTCWVTLQGGMGRALIDTGSQLNVMQLSTARALNVRITEMDQSTLPKELQQGMITADGEMNPFVGTAYSVPVSISGVVIPTHFRIVRRLQRAILLGTPWCSAAQLRIQFDTFGKTLCFIKSIDNQREISFIGCEPAPPADALSMGDQGKLLSFSAQKQYLRVSWSSGFSKTWRSIRTFLGQKITEEKNRKSSLSEQLDSERRSKS